MRERLAAVFLQCLQVISSASSAIGILEPNTPHCLLPLATIQLREWLSPRLDSFTFQICTFGLIIDQELR